MYYQPPGDQQPFDGFPAVFQDTNTGVFDTIRDYKEHALRVLKCRGRHDETWVQFGPSAYYACRNCMTMAYR